MTQHRHTLDAEGEARRERGELLCGSRAASQAVDDEADIMSARDLFACQIEDMAEQAAEGGTQDVQDPQFAVGLINELAQRADHADQA